MGLGSIAPVEGMVTSMHALSAHEARAISRHADLLRQLGVSDPVIFAVGANEGQTVRAYLDALPSATSWAFEPNPELADALIAMNEPRLRVMPVALGAQRGSVELKLRADNRVSSVLEVEPELARRSSHYDTVGVVQAPVETVDDLTEGVMGLPVPHVLSTDTQGYDLEVMRGAARALETGSILIITSEIYFASAYVGQPQAHEVMAYLAGFGYRLYGCDRLVEATSGTLYFGNGVFLSPKAWRGLGLL